MSFSSSPAGTLFNHSIVDTPSITYILVAITTLGLAAVTMKSTGGGVSSSTTPEPAAASETTPPPSTVTGGRKNKKTKRRRFK